MVHFTQSPWRVLFGLLIITLTVGAPALAAPPLANTQFGGTVVSWEPQVGYDHLVLRVSGPAGDFSRTFAEGEVPFFDLSTLEGPVDGSYTFELTAVPHLTPEVRQMLQAARDREDSGLTLRRLQTEGVLPAEPLVQTGYLTVVGGQFITPEGAEPAFDGGGLQSRTTGGESVSSAGGESVRNISAADQVILDDLIVDGSACIGQDCVNGENFGFDTVRLKENNLRIKFDDTSNSGSFPNNDWQLTANDSANGGANKFSITDASAGRDPFTIEAGAPANSLYVDDGGRIGLGTSTPVVELHVVDGDSPALRLEQDGSSGFTAQTWDVAGNETNFFVRDVTGGSQLPFRIIPGADSSSLVITADNDILIAGNNATLADASLHVKRTDGTAKILVEEAGGTEASRVLMDLINNGQVRYTLRDTSADGESWEISNLNSGFNISQIGTGGAEVIITQRDPTGATNVMTVDGDIAAVDFNMTSSRELKSGLAGLNVRDVLSRLMSLDLFEWTFKTDSSGTRHMGPMAEDFHEIFSLSPDPKHISLVDSNGVALAAIQGLYQVVEEKDQKINELQAAVAQLKSLVESLVSQKE